MRHLKSTYVMKRNLQRQVHARRKWGAQRRENVTLQRIGDDDIYLPAPYQRHAPMTYGTGKALTRIISTINIGMEVVGES